MCEQLDVLLWGPTCLCCQLEDQLDFINGAWRTNGLFNVATTPSRWEGWTEQKRSEEGQSVTGSEKAVLVPFHSRIMDRQETTPKL
jgi:hypothetical protein